MSVGGELPAFFSGQAPIFALPSTVLFPGARLPLHIFEPRYREMTRRALEGDRLIAIALLRPGWESDYEGNPPVHGMATVGQIIMEQAFPDGRYNIVLEGLARFRVGELVQEAPYRIARGELVHDLVDPVEEAAVRTKGLHLHALGERVAAEDFRFAAAAARALCSGAEPGRLADLLAAELELDVSTRQEILEAADVGARVEAVAAQLKARLEREEEARRRKAGGEPWKWN
ncbi:MAG: LON peptidase substrate-binding domain-containing protein [Planctomycetia bacterium]|nr:LON peptidase substrate-binding domain-containing protein [Planctomycetia bacterium]